MEKYFFGGAGHFYDLLAHEEGKFSGLMLKYFISAQHCTATELTLKAIYPGIFMISAKYIGHF